MGMTEEARKEAINKAVQAYSEKPGKGGAINLPYKDGTEGPFIVVKVPVQAVVFNPKSHRIKAQLESHEKREIVANEPYADEAQHVIHEILTDTDGFEALTVNLKEYGQRDPGVVTRDGLLVNANRRLAALRVLDPNGYIDAALLPSDADEHAIDRLELSLQVQRDFKQDYTFTNELIFIYELLNVYGYSPEEAAKALNWAASADESELKKGVARVQQSRRIYAAVRDIQKMSDGAIPITYFDDQKQTLIDSDQAYEAMKDTDSDAAERMREGRILGLLAGVGYEDSRKITGASTTSTLVPHLESKPTLVNDATALTSDSQGDTALENAEDDDTALLEGNGDGQGAGGPSLRPLVEIVAKSFGRDTVALPSGEVERDQVIADIAEAIEDTADEVRRTDKAIKSIRGPLDSLDEAARRARAAAEGFEQAKDKAGFDLKGFKTRVANARTEIEAIEQAVRNHEAT